MNTTARLHHSTTLGGIFVVDHYLSSLIHSLERCSRLENTSTLIK